VSRILSVSVSDELLAETEAIARVHGKTKSEFVRDALRRQVWLERFRATQQGFREQAELRGIGPEDVEALIDEVRGERA
jgi:predicted transcriptional regulator